MAARDRTPAWAATVSVRDTHYWRDRERLIVHATRAPAAAQRAIEAALRGLKKGTRVKEVRLLLTRLDPVRGERESAGQSGALTISGAEREEITS